MRAQEGPIGPIAPAPEHEVKRVSNNPEPEAPPDLPPDQIIQRFAKKEEEYLLARTAYSFRRTIRINEYGPDGEPSGEFLLVTEPARGSDGRLFEKVIEQPRSTLRTMQLVHEDVASLARIPAYPLIASQLPRYNIKFAGKEMVDEIDCYIFQVKPKAVDRQVALFEGIVWVDAKYLEVVKTYGKFVTDLGAVHSPTLPFTMFETYRENVDGKYWLPNYSRSDDRIQLQDGEVPIRVVIKWTGFKPISGASAAPVASAPASPASAKP